MSDEKVFGIDELEKFYLNYKLRVTAWKSCQQFIVNELQRMYTSHVGLCSSDILTLVQGLAGSDCYCRALELLSDYYRFQGRIDTFLEFSLVTGHCDIE